MDSHSEDVREALQYGDAQAWKEDTWDRKQKRKQDGEVFVESYYENVCEALQYGEAKAWKEDAWDQEQRKKEAGGEQAFSPVNMEREEEEYTELMANEDRGLPIAERLALTKNALDMTRERQVGNFMGDGEDVLAALRYCKTVAWKGDAALLDSLAVDGQYPALTLAQGLMACCQATEDRHQLKGRKETGSQLKRRKWTRGMERAMYRGTAVQEHIRATLRHRAFVELVSQTLCRHSKTTDAVCALMYTMHDFPKLSRRLLIACGCMHGLQMDIARMHEDEGLKITGLETVDKREAVYMWCREQVDNSKWTRDSSRGVEEDIVNGLAWKLELEECNRETFTRNLLGSYFVGDHEGKAEGYARSILSDFAVQLRDPARVKLLRKMKMYLHKLYGKTQSPAYCLAWYRPRIRVKRQKEEDEEEMEEGKKKMKAAEGQKKEG